MAVGVIRLDVVPRRVIDQETPLALVRRARAINRALTQLYPDAHCELDFTNPLELLVATILSAQCTDKRVNMVTPVLFAKYPTAADYAGADRAEIEAIIMSTGFFRAKTTSIIGMAQASVRPVPRRGAAPPEGPRHAARRRSQDRERRSRQRVRHPWPDRRHAHAAPLEPPALDDVR